MYTFSKNTKMITYILMAIGAVAIGYGFATDPHRVWPNILAGNFFFLAIALASLFFMALQYVTEAGWSAAIKRVPEAISQYLPIAGGIMLVIFIAAGMHWNHIYHWLDGNLYYEWLLPDGNLSHEMAEGAVANPEYDSIIAGKKAYLNFPFFIIRALVYLGVWTWAAKKLRQLSLAEDLVGGTENHYKSIKVSAFFIVFFAITSSMAAWDWIMSIDTHWFSTLFGWYVFSGMFVSAITAITLVVLHLKSKGHLELVNESHLHDLGKFMFAFSIFWTYLWFCQFMLIWYANIPEEVTYYMARWDNYKVPFWTMVFINFAFPVLALMSREAKRIKNYLVVTGFMVILGHYMDVFVMIMPGTTGDNAPHFGFIEIGTFLGFAGLFTNFVLRQLAKSPLVAKNHPFIEESKHHHI
jgi:hypothetical protein